MNVWGAHASVLESHSGEPVCAGVVQWCTCCCAGVMQWCWSGAVVYQLLRLSGVVHGIPVAVLEFRSLWCTCCCAGILQSLVYLLLCSSFAVYYVPFAVLEFCSLWCTCCCAGVVRWCSVWCMGCKARGCTAVSKSWADAAPSHGTCDRPTTHGCLGTPRARLLQTHTWGNTAHYVRTSCTRHTARTWITKIWLIADAIQCYWRINQTSSVMKIRIIWSYRFAYISNNFNF